MKLVLLTNMPSVHQAQLGAELSRILGADNFRLVFAKPTSDAREEMGWADHFDAPYILRRWESATCKEEVERWIETADVVVQGRYPIRLVRQRIKAGKLTFAYQERFWKRNFHWARVAMRLPRIIGRYWSVMRPNYHLLAAGAYVAPDLARLGCFNQRAWKFGYFIQAEERLARRTVQPTLKLLWCARFSPVKRAADALQIVRGLRARNVECQLIMVGDGEQRHDVELQAADLVDVVSFAGWQSAEVVAQHMQQADIFLMTSGFAEGWAMVINEAQNAACTVVANRLVGAAPWLINDGFNGLLYDQDKIDTLCEQLARLSHEKIQQMGIAGHQSHEMLWSAKVAGGRLVKLAECLLREGLDQAQSLFVDGGPCSRA